MALGTLTKGPVAVALPVLIYVIDCGIRREGLRPSARGWFGLRSIDVVVAGLVFIVVALPWYLAMAETHGVAYLKRFFVGENLERFATARYNGRRAAPGSAPRSSSAAWPRGRRCLRSGSRRSLGC